ncbi:lipocalin family protein [Spirosoma sp. SC4-14]|uniref:lipocalin family protein n=1 Tax=Spirosoma sp. SC4-14 TaxID=3128900 RepID=UPI0030CCC306
MKQRLLLPLLCLLLIGLINACTQGSNDVTVSGPIVGQWDINRYVISDLPDSYSTLNGTINSNLGTDTYTFRTDSTYSESYSSANTQTKGTEEGTWSLRDSVLTIRPVSASPGQTPAPYALKYIKATGELSSGKFQTSEQIQNPTTNVVETITYNLEFFYVKRY